MPPGGMGRSPEKIRNTLTVGHSRHLTSGGTAVAEEKLLLKNLRTYELVLDRRGEGRLLTV